MHGEGGSSPCAFAEEKKTTDTDCKDSGLDEHVLVLQNPEAESFQRSQLFKNVRAHEVLPWREWVDTSMPGFEIYLCRTLSTRSPKRRARKIGMLVKLKTLSAARSDDGLFD
jgi:hypothetical protein